MHTDIQECGTETLKMKLKRRLLQDHSSVVNALVAHKSCLVQTNSQSALSTPIYQDLDSQPQQTSSLVTIASQKCTNNSGDVSFASDTFLKDTMITSENRTPEIDEMRCPDDMFYRLSPSSDNKFRQKFPDKNISCSTASIPRQPDVSILYKLEFW